MNPGRSATKRPQVCQNCRPPSRRKNVQRMVGQFLELSIAAQPLAESFEFYQSLGFASLPVGDSLPDPYLVLFDGRVAIGLHDREQPATVDIHVTFF